MARGLRVKVDFGWRIGTQRAHARVLGAKCQSVLGLTEATAVVTPRRLEETKGRSESTDQRTFGGYIRLQGDLEVDLLCPHVRVAIELDGAQHLADVDAYRRDRGARITFCGRSARTARRMWL
jgi:hypothetical protein